MKYRIVTFLVFGAAIFWLTEQDSLEKQMASPSQLDRLWLDFCMANSADKLSDAAVTMIRLDDSYEPALPSDELTRLDYAVILANIEKFTPPSVAIVPPLTWPEPNVINQKALQSQVKKMPPLTLGAIVENSPVGAEPAGSLPFASIKQFEGEMDSLTPFTRSVSLPEKEALINGQAAITRIELSNTSSKDIVSHVPLIARHGDTVVPTFILQALLSYNKLTPDEVKIQLPPVVKRGVILVGDRYRIPVNRSGHMKTYQHADIRPPLYQHVSANELPLAHSQEPEIKALQKELEDEFQSLSRNLVVIGLDRDSDQHILWDEGNKISLTSLIVRSIATIQSGRFIEQWTRTGRMAGFAVIAILALWLYRFSRRKVLVWGLMFTFLYFGACVFLFHNTLLWTPPFTPLCLFATLILTGIILPDQRSSLKTPEPQPIEEEIDNIF